MEDWSLIDVHLPENVDTKKAAKCLGTKVTVVETGEPLKFVREVRFFMRFNDVLRASVERIQSDDKGNPIVNPEDGQPLRIIERYTVRTVTVGEE